MDEDGRKKVDSFIRELDASFPNKDSVYEFFLDPKSLSWVHWEEKLRGGWKYDPEYVLFFNTVSFHSKSSHFIFYCFRQPFYKILVPTVDTVRYNYLVNTLVAAQSPVLITGPVGTGKTSVAQDVLFNLDKEYWSFLIINMSAQVRVNSGEDLK